MNNRTKRTGKHLLALLLALTMMFSLMCPTVFAGQEDGYHDPAKNWITASNRTSEFDANTLITHETFLCPQCNKVTSFLVFRTPEYTRTGITAKNNGVLYSDGTTFNENGTANLDFGVPGIDSYYTGYHWTKSVCENCGTINANMGTESYAYERNIYYLNDCATAFMRELPKEITYESTDGTYHTKTTSGSKYCCFCYGTRYENTSVLEEHDLNRQIVNQPSNGRFVLMEDCSICDYQHSEHIPAKTVIEDYYGPVDGQAHTVTINEFSDENVSVDVRYGSSMDDCTLNAAPNYTEAGRYNVYYQITYTYQETNMVENGVATVWLYDTNNVPPTQNPQPDPGQPSPQPQGGNPSHAHNFSLLESVAPTCLTLGYDRYVCACGAVENRNYTNALGHDWHNVVVREANCNNDGLSMNICSRCGATETVNTPKGAHQYTTSTVAASCVSPGYTLKECSICGDRQITNLSPITAHHYTDTTIPASCESGGFTTHTCVTCGTSNVTDYTAALGHSWDNGTTITTATCTGEGVTEYRCVRCDRRRIEGETANGHVPGPVATCTTPQLCTKCGAVLAEGAGHHYRASVTAPTCTEMGYTTFTCTNCEDTYRGSYTNPTGHTFEEVVTEPTCTEGGYTTYTCAECGQFFVTDRTAALGHSWDAGTAVTTANCLGAGVTEYRCVRCDQLHLEAESATGHTPGTTATCTQPRLCTVCGVVLAEALGHHYESADTLPSCTEMGYTAYTCTTCGDTYQGSYTNPTGHHFQVIVTVPTCTEGGYTTHTCPDCGTSFVTDQTDALHHAWNEGETITAANCLGAGVTEYRCVHCNEIRLETASATGHTPGAPATCTQPQLCTACGTILTEALEHSYERVVTTPTCTAMGYTTFTCSACKDTYKGEYTNPTGHHYEDTVTAPTCLEGGYTTHTCADCGKTFRTDPTEALGHEWDEGTTITMENCLGAGVMEYRCVRCDYHRLEAQSATGHTPGVPATCTSPQLCTVCGAVLAEATGHDYTATVTTPTCTVMGYTTFTCAVCGDTYKGEYTDPTGHNYEDTVTAPTCLEGGYTTHTCTGCDRTFVTDYTEALGHSWDEGTPVATPNCMGGGVTEYRCVRCDYHRLEAKSSTGHTPSEVATCTQPQLCTACGAVLQPALEHHYVPVVTAPTCTEMGFTTFACDRCEASYQTGYTEPTGHHFQAVVTEPTCLEGGYTTHTCEGCGKTFVTNPTQALGHGWDEGELVTAASCMGAGVMDYRCVRCDYHHLAALDATGHTLGEPATCTTPQVCTVCEAIIVSPLGHTYEGVVTAPTCTAMGYTTFTCSACKDTYKTNYKKSRG